MISRGTIKNILKVVHFTGVRKEMTETILTGLAYESVIAMALFVEDACAVRQQYCFFLGFSISN